MNELPKEIKHRICHFLNMYHGTRASAVSKAWKSAWDSRPLMVFQPGYIRNDRIDDHVERSLQRQIDSGFSTVALRFDVNVCSQRLADAIRRFALTANIVELELRVINQSRSNLNLLSSHTLSKLKLSGIDLNHPGPGNRWDFPRLRSLELAQVTLGSAEVEELVSASPMLEAFTLSGVNNAITTLNIHHERLKRVELCFDPNLHKIALRVPSLESFICHHKDFTGAPMIELDACETTLMELSISGIKCTAEWVQSQIHKFPNLKVLILERLGLLTKLKISSTHLTNLRIIACRSLGSFGTEIYAPNLLHLDYVNNKFPFYPLANCGSSLETIFFASGLECAVRHKSDWFDKLAELFVMINDMSNVMITIICKPKIAIVHRGVSEALFDILVDLVKSALLYKVIITSNFKYWARMTVNPNFANDVFVASTYDDYDRLSERFSKMLRYGLNLWHIRCLQSYTIEPLDDWCELESDDETRHALVRAYSESSSRFTRFCLRW